MGTDRALAQPMQQGIVLVTMKPFGIGLLYAVLAGCGGAVSGGAGHKTRSSGNS